MPTRKASKRQNRSKAGQKQLTSKKPAGKKASSKGRARKSNSNKKVNPVKSSPKSKPTKGVRPLSKKAKKQPKDNKPPSLSRLFWEFRKALSLAEKCSYFHLDEETRKTLAPFQDPRSGLPQIKRWSFTIHPNVINDFALRTGNLQRYIVAIDTRMSSIYFPVKKYLESLGTNVTTFYSGGWADFLCDVQLNRSSFERFLYELKGVLIDNGIKRIERDVNNVISIFDVGRTLVLCGEPLGSFVTPSNSAIDLIRQNPVRFDVVHEDYRSRKAQSLFRKPKDLRDYLEQLKAAGIIVCFKIVFDFSYWISRDYVPMILGEKRGAEITMEELLSQAKQRSDLLGPVEELLQIDDVISLDSAEKEVKYFFINSYEVPGARDEWKRAIYEAAKVDVNIYNYPLEGALNETPVYLSELPELLQKAKEYQFNEGQLIIGAFHHELLSAPIEIALAKNGLARHGITLGEPESGKTTTDLGLANAARKVLSKVIIFDASGGIRGKLASLPKPIFQSLEIVAINAGNAADEFRRIVDADGFYFFEGTSQDAPEVFSILLNEIERLDDAAKDEEARQVRNLLLVEEAGEVLGRSEKKRENVDRLLQLLEESYRKGWSMWFSTQHPSSITYDTDVAVQLLKALRNRIILAQTSEVETLLEVFRSENLFTQDDADYLSSTVGELQSGEALIRGVAFTPTERNLPLIRVKSYLLKALD